MLILQPPLRILDPLQRHRAPVDALGRDLYSIRAGQLVVAEALCGQDRWRCRITGRSEHLQCQVVLTGADLATALDPALLAEDGHPDPHRQLIAFRAAWRSQAWQRCGSRAGAVAEALTGDVGTDLLVDLDPVYNRSRALGLHMLPDGLERQLLRLAAAGLLTVLDNDQAHRAVLTLAPLPEPATSTAASGAPRVLVAAVSRMRTPQ